MTTGSPIYLVTACETAEQFVAAFRRYADRVGVFVFVPTATPLEAGRRGHVALALRDGGVVLEGDAEIVSASTKPSGAHGRAGMTIRFIAPDDTVRGVFAELDKARLSPKPPATTLAPRAVALPRTPRPTPPTTGGKIDAGNARAESVVIEGPIDLNASSTALGMTPPTIAATTAAASTAASTVAPEADAGDVAEIVSAVPPSEVSGPSGPASTTPSGPTAAARSKPLTTPPMGSRSQPTADSPTSGKPGAALPKAGPKFVIPSIPSMPPIGGAAGAAGAAGARSKAPSIAPPTVPPTPTIVAPASKPPREDPTVPVSTPSFSLKSAAPATGSPSAPAPRPAVPSSRASYPPSPALARPEPTPTPTAPAPAPRLTIERADPTPPRTGPSRSDDNTLPTTTPAFRRTDASARLERREPTPEPGASSTLPSSAPPPTPPSEPADEPRRVPFAPQAPQVSIITHTQQTLVPPPPELPTSLVDVPPFPPEVSETTDQTDVRAIQPRRPVADSSRRTSLGVAVALPAVELADELTDSRPPPDGADDADHDTRSMAVARPTTDTDVPSDSVGDHRIDPHAATLQPEPGAYAMPARTLRTDPVIAAVEAAGGDWTMTPDALAPTPLPPKPAKIVAPMSGDWVIALDSGSPDGWAPPQRVEQPVAQPAPARKGAGRAAPVRREPVEGAGPPVAAVASAEPLSSTPRPEPVDAGAKGPKVEIDPTLIEPAPVIAPLPAFDSAPAQMSPPHAALPLAQQLGSPLQSAAFPANMIPTPYPVAHGGHGVSIPTPYPLAAIPPGPYQGIPSTPLPPSLPPPPHVHDAHDSVLDMPQAHGYGVPVGPGGVGYDGAPVGSGPAYAAQPYDANGHYVPNVAHAPHIPTTPGHQMQMMGFAPPAGVRGHYGDPALADPTSQVAIRRKQRTLVIVVSAAVMIGIGIALALALGGGHATPAQTTTTPATPAASGAPSTTASTAAAPSTGSATPAIASAPPPVAGSNAVAAAAIATAPLDAGTGSAAPTAAGSNADAGVAGAAGSDCSVDVKTSPSGAEVSRDENTVIGTTPVKLALPCEPIKLYIRKAHYIGAIKLVTPTADGVAINVKLYKATFQIKVSSQPAGATVSIGGKTVGTTPTIVKVVAYEPASITIAKDGYTPDTEKVTPKQNNMQVHAVLKKLAKHAH